MRFDGLGYRAHDPRWSFKPLSGEGASIHGGRFNPKGTPALYVALDPITAIKEAAQGFARKFEPCVLCSYEIDCEDVIDLRTKAQRKAEGVSEEDVACAWFADAAAGREPPSWRLARRLIGRRAAGLIAPSYVNGRAPTTPILSYGAGAAACPTKFWSSIRAAVCRRTNSRGTERRCAIVSCSFVPTKSAKATNVERTEELRMPRTSAGVLLFRRRPAGVEVMLVHPGGPFWRNKDDGAWSIPKGLADEGEDLLAAAKREFLEETGATIGGAFIDLGAHKQPGGKTIVAFGAEGDFDAASLRSNMFSMEWPPRSGKTAEFPEVDRAGWFDLDEALAKVTKGQRPIIAALAAKLAKDNGEPG